MAEKKDNIVCRRCGGCCQVDMIAYSSPEDIVRWDSEGRQDIIARVRGNKVMWAGDRLINEKGTKIMTCSFLGWENGQFLCMIYETRPKVCRDYEPGSSLLCPQSSRDK